MEFPKRDFVLKWKNKYEEGEEIFEDISLDISRSSYVCIFILDKAGYEIIDFIRDCIDADEKEKIETTFLLTTDITTPFSTYYLSVNKIKGNMVKFKEYFI